MRTLLLLVLAIGSAPQDESTVLNGHTGMVVSAAFSPDGKRLASASWCTDSNPIRIWDLETGKELRAIAIDAWVAALAFSPDGTLLASKDLYGAITLWDARTGKPVRRMECGGGEYASLEFSADGTLLASGGSGAMSLWDAKTGELKDCIRWLSGAVSLGVFSRDRKIVAAGRLNRGFDRAVEIVDFGKGEVRHSLSGHSGEVIRLSFSPDGSTVASAAQDRTVKIWDVVAGKEIHTLALSARAVAFSPDGKALAIGGDSLELRDSRTAKRLRFFDGARGVWCVAFSSDGKRLAAGGDKGSLRVWRLDPR